jgi:lipopolysaccharide transport system ATP-binding protein
MSKTVISVENLSKSYRLGQIGTGTLSRDLEVWWAKVRGKPNPLLKIGQTDHGNQDGQTLWALQDVSFQVQQGEVLGIIGRNGAGKSTLLKILSRVTAPTSGQVKVKGRIASLLEVGTGFHPELTGRENIFLNGAILGMSRQEVQRKFEEIVSFAEVEKFVDTPVKRYSSGMYVRLAFAVAAHLESEILLVDEVLAVGDAEFQKKCLGKMGDVASKEGRTVLFVSHNMSAIETLCSTCLLLNRGQNKYIGKTIETITEYVSLAPGANDRNNFKVQRQISENRIGEYRSINIVNENNQIINNVRLGDEINIKLDFQVFQEIRNPIFSVRISNQIGQNLIYWHSGETCGILPSTKNGGSIKLHVESLNLLPGLYNISIGFSDGFQTIDLIENALTFEITAKAIYPTGKIPDSKRGLIYTLCNWEVNYS